MNLKKKATEGSLWLHLKQYVQSTSSFTCDDMGCILLNRVSGISTASCMNRASVFEWHKRFKEGRKSVMRSVGGVKKSIHQSWLAKGLGLGLGLLWWGFKRVHEEIPWEETSTLQIGLSGISNRTMHQSTTPSLSHTIWPGWASRQFLSLPIVQTLLPVTFAYSLSSEAVVMRELRRWKRLWWRSLTRPHNRTSMVPSRSCWNDKTHALQLEEITSKGTRVSCVYYQEKGPYEKSLETYLMILVYECFLVLLSEVLSVAKKKNPKWQWYVQNLIETVALESVLTVPLMPMMKRTSSSFISLVWYIPYHKFMLK